MSKSGWLRADTDGIISALKQRDKIRLRQLLLDEANLKPERFGLNLAHIVVLMGDTQAPFILRKILKSRWNGLLLGRCNSGRTPLQLAQGLNSKGMISVLPQSEYTKKHTKNKESVSVQSGTHKQKQVERMPRDQFKNSVEGHGVGSPVSSPRLSKRVRLAEQVESLRLLLRPQPQQIPMDDRKKFVGNAPKTARQPSEKHKERSKLPLADELLEEVYDKVGERNKRTLRNLTHGH